MAEVEDQCFEIFRLKMPKRVWQFVVQERGLTFFREVVPEFAEDKSFLLHMAAFAFQRLAPITSASGGESCVFGRRMHAQVCKDFGSESKKYWKIYKQVGALIALFSVMSLDGFGRDRA